MIAAVPGGEAQSGTNIADISSCSSCELAVADYTGTFGIPQQHVAVGGDKLANISSIVPDCSHKKRRE